MEEKFTPEIIAFCCHYCAYAAADLAGSMRLDYPSSIKIIEMPCTGKVDPIYILQALEDVQAPAAAGALKGVGAVCDMLEFLQYELGDYEHAVDEPGLANVRDPAVNYDAGVHKLQVLLLVMARDAPGHSGDAEGGTFAYANKHSSIAQK